MIRTTAPFVFALIAFALVLPTGSASAKGDLVGLSYDAHTWSARLRQPLFSPKLRWIPGAVRTAYFFVRNQGQTGANLSIAVRVRDRHGLYADRQVRLKVRKAGGRWQTLSARRTGIRLGQLARQAKARVSVRARFVAPAGNATMRRSLSFKISARLSQGAHDADNNTGNGAQNGPGQHSGSSGSGLPDTGAPAVGFAAMLALMLLTGGAALIARNSRKEAP